jgi:hypothetical protein
MGSIASVQRDVVLTRVATLLSLSDKDEQRQQTYVFDLNGVSSGGIAFSADVVEEDYYSMKLKTDTVEDGDHELSFAESRATKLTHTTLPPMHSSTNSTKKEPIHVDADNIKLELKLNKEEHRIGSHDVDLERGIIALEGEDDDDMNMERGASLTADNNEVLNSFKQKVISYENAFVCLNIFLMTLCSL